jgi:hypothetical protein
MMKTTQRPFRDSPISITFVVLLLTHFTVRAQHTTGDLQFRVVDSLGNAISGANAIVTGPQVQGVRGGTSDELGYVNILAIQPGSVSVKISHSAFQPVVFENVLIQLGKTATLGEVRLHGRMHELAELVISVRSPLLDPGTTYSGSNIRKADIEGLPVDRNYRGIVSLLPQANTSYFGDEVNVAGATGWENKYFVDGIDVTDSFLGMSGTNLPYNFVSEIEVREGGYEAEYPSALGGIVNVITPSGGNEFHGSASGFFTSNRFTSSKRVGLLDPTQGGFSDYDAGLGIGGPLIRDQLWFYAAYNPKVEQRDVAVPNFGTTVDRRITNSFAGKLTWRPLQSMSLTLLSTGDPNEWHAVGEGITPSGLLNPDPYLSDQKHGGVNLSLHGTYAFEGGFLVDASFSRTTQKGVWQGATERGRNEVLFEDGGDAGVWSGGLGFFVNRFIYSNTYNVNGTLISGSHILKSGFQYKVAGVDEDDGGKRYIRWSDISYQLQQDRAKTTVGDRIPSLYIQDAWRIFEGFRLNFGVRWDNQSIVASNGLVAQKFTREFQPRIGIVLLPDKDGFQKVFASFGRFYQELSTDLSENYSDQRYNIGINYKHDPRIDPSGGDTAWNIRAAIQDEVTGITGQYYDEFNLGYERLLAEHFKIGVQGVYRTLREAVNYVYLRSDSSWHFGNPGTGPLSAFPKAQRDYMALVFTVQGQGGEHLKFLASYVLSRNYGNYTGLFDPYSHTGGSANNGTFGGNDNAQISTGLLPNDRTHVFKLSGSYHFDFGLTAGTSFSWQSGTPLSDMASDFTFLAPRGTSGRTPAIWDLNARLAYDLPLLTEWRTRLLLDVFHIGSQQNPVDIVQEHYLDSDRVYPNPDYGLAFRYQPAMSVRLGMEVSF